MAMRYGMRSDLVATPNGFFQQHPLSFGFEILSNYEERRPNPVFIEKIQGIAQARFKKRVGFASVCPAVNLENVSRAIQINVNRGAHLNRSWSQGNELRLTEPMPPQSVKRSVERNWLRRDPSDR